MYPIATAEEFVAEPQMGGGRVATACPWAEFGRDGANFAIPRRCAHAPLPVQRPSPHRPTTRKTRKRTPSDTCAVPSGPRSRPSPPGSWSPGEPPRGARAQVSASACARRGSATTLHDEHGGGSSLCSTDPALTTTTPGIALNNTTATRHAQEQAMNSRRCRSLTESLEERKHHRHTYVTRMAMHFGFPPRLQHNSNSWLACSLEHFNTTPTVQADHRLATVALRKKIQS